MRGTRLLDEDMYVVEPVTTSVFDAALGRNVTQTSFQRLHAFKGTYQPVLRIEPPIVTDFRSDQRGVLRGRVYAKNEATTRLLLSTTDRKIEVKATGEILTPILKPKGQGGSFKRLRIDTGDWV